MITVLDYNHEYAQALADILNKAGFEAKASLNEAVLCKSHKLIFPPATEIGSILRKFHLLNLYSLLRMVKKPVLGIASGIELMLEFAIEKKESALCYFPELSERFGIQQVSIEKKSYPIHLIADCPILNGIAEGTDFVFDYALSIAGKLEIVKAAFSPDSQLPAVCQKGEAYSVLFDLLASGTPGEDILKNFAALEVTHEHSCI
jgi:glutamine amidotransferase